MTSASAPQDLTLNLQSVRTSSASIVYHCGTLDVSVLTPLMSAPFPGGSEGKASVHNAGDWVQSLGREDPLKKDMTTPLQYWEEPGGLSMGSQRVRHDWATSLTLFMKQDLHGCFIVWIRNNMDKWRVQSRWWINAMHLVMLTATPRVRMPISAFYLWFQDHILPTKLTLGLEIALWTPAVPPFQFCSKWHSNGIHWQFHCLGLHG